MHRVLAADPPAMRKYMREKHKKYGSARWSKQATAEKAAGRKVITNALLVNPIFQRRAANFAIYTWNMRALSKGVTDFQACTVGRYEGSKQQHVNEVQRNR